MTKPEYNKDYSDMDMMIIAAARTIKDYDVIYTGVGFPIEAAVMAKNLHAPNCTIMLENGIVRSSVFRLPYTTDTMESQLRAELLTGLAYVNCAAQAGFVTLGFMGGGQVDRYGNVNDHVVGDYLNPTHRWMGSGGANDLMSFCGRTIIILKQSKRRFPEHVDFVTCPGFLDGKPDQRGNAGLPAGNGPAGVVTNMATFTFEDREMTLKSIHTCCGYTLEQVKEELGWDVKISSDYVDTEPPTREEVDVFVEKVANARRTRQGYGRSAGGFFH